MRKERSSLSQTIKHSGGMHEWSCWTASGTQPLVLIDNVIADRRSMNSERYRGIFSAHVQPYPAKVVRQHSTVQMDNDPKHTAKATQVTSQSLDRNPIEHGFQVLKKKLRERNPQTSTNSQEETIFGVIHWSWTKGRR